MGSIYQSLGLDNVDPKKQSTGNASDRDNTIAHLLVASGYAAAKVDQVSLAAYSSPITDTKPLLFKSATDATTASPIRAAESVSIGTAPPLIRSALTSNLLSAEPTMIKAQLAAEDPNTRNLTQTDAALPRVNTGQPDVPVLRLLKESGAVQVATQVSDGAASGVVAARVEAPAPRAVVQQNTSSSGPPRTESVINQVVVNRDVNGNPIASVVAASAQIKSDGTPLPAQVRSVDTVGTQIRNVDTTGAQIRNVDTTGAQIRNVDTTGTPTRTVDTTGTPIRTVDTTGTPIRTVDPSIAAQVRSVDPSIGTQIRSTETSINSNLQTRNDVVPGTLPSTAVRSDSPLSGQLSANRPEHPTMVSGKVDSPVSASPTRADGPSIGNQGRVDGPAQPRLDVATTSLQNVAVQTGLRSAEVPSATASDAGRTPPLLPTSQPISSIIAQARAGASAQMDTSKSNVDPYDRTDYIQARNAPAQPTLALQSSTDRPLPTAATQSSTDRSLPAAAAQSPTDKLPPSTGLQSPADRVPPSTGLQSPIDRVPPSTGLQSPADRVPPSTGLQSPTDKVPPSTGLQSPTDKVPPSTGLQSPTDKVPPSTGLQSPAERVPPSTGLQSPTEKVPPSTGLQSPTERGTLQNQPLQDVLAKTNTTGTIPERPGAPDSLRPSGTAPGVVPERGPQDRTVPGGPTDASRPLAPSTGDTSTARILPGEVKSAENRTTAQGDLAASRTPFDGRAQDPNRVSIDGRAQDPQRVNVDGTRPAGQETRLQDIPKPGTENRPVNQEGTPRTAEQRNAEGPKGELGRANSNEGRITDGGKLNFDGLQRNPENRANFESKSVDGAGRTTEYRAEARNLDGSSVRNQDTVQGNRFENQTGKLDTARFESASNRISQESMPARSTEMRSENIANRNSEQRPENASTRAGELRSENAANRANEFRPENIANRINELRPDNTANRTNELRPDNTANRTNEPRPDNSTNKTGEVRSETAANRSTENASTRPNESSRPSELPSTKPGDIRTDVPVNRVGETPVNNTDAKTFDPSSSKQSDLTNVRADGSKTPDIGDIKSPDRVGLNVDIIRQSGFAAPTDLVATQKEAAAIRQVLSELKQNQNLSASEVLELPAFKEAMRLLDALKPKEAEVQPDGKQHFTTSFVEAMRLSDFLKVLEKTSEVEQKKIHKQQWAARSLAQSQHRVRYLVQKEDTLESVAEKILGDVRFVQLLVTINRAEIIFTVVNGKSVSTIYEGQYLWIPTPNEVSIHRKHYFNANSASGRGEPIAPEAETPIMVEEYEAPTTVRDFATRLRSVTAPPVGAPMAASGGPLSSPMAVVLYRLRFAGNRNSVNLDDVEEAPVEDRRRHKVRLGETLQSIAVHDELMKDVNMWVLICRVNDLDTAVDVVGRPRAQINRGDILLLPHQADIDEFQLLNKLMEIAKLAGKQLDIDLSRKPVPAPKAKEKAAAHCKVDRQMSIESLWERCRMILTDNDDRSYSIKLQRDTMEGKWTTVASYESNGEKTLRWTYKIDGSKNCLEVGLPASVSREMAIEDFRRNWRFYYNRYTSIKTDTLELLDLSEAANR